MAAPKKKKPTPKSAEGPDVAAQAAELSHGHAKMVRIFLGAVCFLAGASVMVIEISAFRLLAPLFGNTVYTWTALIGVILISFSAGGYLGGHLADRKLALDLLGWLLAGASVLTLFIPALYSVLGPNLSGADLITGPTMISMLLFAVPGVLLGAVSPAAVRFYSLTMKDTHVGGAAGTISMLGSLGSFVGTVLSGFVLLSAFGVRSIFTGTGVLLLILSVLSFLLAKNNFKQLLPILISGLFAGILGASSKPPSMPDAIYEEDSFYHRIEVSETGEGRNQRRILQLDSTMEGGMNPDDGSLVLDYQHFWKLVRLNPDFELQSAAFIGAGAFGMPEEVSRTFPEATVDVIEIDPKVIEVGRKFFKLDEHPRVAAHADDARRYLLKSGKAQWDLIFGDAYNGIRQIPSHLVTKEFFELVEARLSENGVFIMNAITAIEGDRAELFDGIIATLRSVFPHVEVFAVGGSRSMSQNVILLASNEDWSRYVTDQLHVPGSWQQRLARTHIPRRQIPGGDLVFTDDYNPVDAIIARGLLK
jgi:spermidine synthase